MWEYICFILCLWPGANDIYYEQKRNNVIRGKGMANKVTYDASSITVLEGLEAVRKRPGMYIGSVTTKGLNHLIYEIVDNSVDEHLAGFCSEIKVTLEADGSARITAGEYPLVCMKRE